MCPILLRTRKNGSLDKNTHKENKNKTGNVWRAVVVEEEVELVLPCESAGDV